MLSTQALYHRFNDKLHVFLHRPIHQSPMTLSLQVLGILAPYFSISYHRTWNKIIFTLDRSQAPPLSTLSEALFRPQHPYFNLQPVQLSYYLSAILPASGSLSLKPAFSDQRKELINTTLKALRILALSNVLNTEYQQLYAPPMLLNYILLHIHGQSSLIH